MKMKSSIGLVLIFLCFAVSAQCRTGRKIPFQLKQRNVGEKVSPQALNQAVEAAIFRMTNQQRVQKGRVSLTSNSILQKVAGYHSRDMLQRRYLSHFSPEGKSVLHRVQKHVKKVETHLGENIHTIESSRGLSDAQAIAELMISDWMKSKSHRKNILSKNFTQLGVACASNGTKIFCTQAFAGANL